MKCSTEIQHNFSIYLKLYIGLNHMMVEARDVMNPGKTGKDIDTKK